MGYNGVMVIDYSELNDKEKVVMLEGIIQELREILKTPEMADMNAHAKILMKNIKDDE